MNAQTWTLARSYLYIVVAAGVVVGYGPVLVASIRPQGSLDIGVLRYSAWLLWAAGCLLLASSVWCFGAGAKSSPAYTEKPERLAVRGPFRYVRNPMYIAQFIIVLGHLVWSGAAYVLIYVLLYGAAIYLIATFYEDPLLRRLFPEAFQDYRQKVPAWLPTLDPYDPSG